MHSSPHSLCVWSYICFCKLYTMKFGILPPNDLITPGKKTLPLCAVFDVHLSQMLAETWTHLTTVHVSTVFVGIWNGLACIELHSNSAQVWQMASPLCDIVPVFISGCRGGQYWAKMVFVLSWVMSLMELGTLRDPHLSLNDQLIARCCLNMM